jgi:hypothetical protein
MVKVAEKFAVQHEEMETLSVKRDGLTLPTTREDAMPTLRRLLLAPLAGHGVNPSLLTHGEGSGEVCGTT